jgi:hypothetical protein
MSDLLQIGLVRPDGAVQAADSQLENVGTRFLSLRHRPEALPFSSFGYAPVWAHRAAIFVRTSEPLPGRLASFRSLTGPISLNLCTMRI